MIYQHHRTKQKKQAGKRLPPSKTTVTSGELDHLPKEKKRVFLGGEVEEEEEEDDGCSPTSSIRRR